MIDIQEHPEGVTVAVKVQAGARENALRGEHGGCLKVAVTAAAQRGKANQAVIALLAEKLGVSPSQVVLLAGHTQPRKRLLLRGWTRDKLAQWLIGAIPPPKDG